jgi:hypothetical protein
VMGFLFAETQKERELYCEFAGRPTYRLSEEHITLIQGAVKLTDQQAILHSSVWKSSTRRTAPALSNDTKTYCNTILCP